ncbi:MAG: hypothetical protein JWQ15_2182, partial [Marmoricola sp.]|nr:hypothetical protein [Marmoricola sp.]
DELTDKVSPQRVVERRKEAAKSSLASVRDKVMGSAQDAKASLGSGSGSGGAGSVKDSAQAAAGTVGSATAGNPLTAGLVAFGAGMLVSALLPASKQETEAARNVVDAAKEHGQPLVDEAKSVGQEMGQELGESAAQAAQQVRTQAQDSVENVKQEGQSSVDQVKDQAPSS